jgi:hypothetical protein
VFNRNVWVRAFNEPDPKGLIDLGLPIDLIMFGSVSPHPEDMADPLAYSEVVAGLPLDQQALIMGSSLESNADRGVLLSTAGFDPASFGPGPRGTRQAASREQTCDSGSDYGSRV